MSFASTSPSMGSLPPRRPSKRSKLRNGTFVIPSTGERSRRQFTLRTASSLTSSREPDYVPVAYAETPRERFDALVHNGKARLEQAWRWIDSEGGHGVLKCSLAYLLGSIPTFCAPVSNWLGNRDGKHIVATLTVYFHPARTVGSMLEAIVIALIAVAYAEIISALSMVAAFVSKANLGHTAPGHIVVLTLFIGGGLGFIGWVKQRLNQPLVNVASTLASIAIISVVTKEDSIQDGYFSAEKTVQVLKMLVMGIFFTTAVNLLVWRVSARRVLRQSVSTASLSLSDKLSTIAKGFLNGTEEELNSPEYAQVTKHYDDAFARMTKLLREAKFEHYFLGTEQIYRLDKRLVKSVEAVYQAIGGLRSALNAQFTLLKEVPSDLMPTADPLSPRSPYTPILEGGLAAVFSDSRDRLSVIDEAVEDEDASPIRETPLQSKSDPTLDQSPIFRSPSDILSLFMALLGPSLKSLTFTLAETLREPPFGEDPNADITVNDQLRESLRDALKLYEGARANALQELYRSIELGRTRSEKIQADIEEVAAACGHFSFSLQAVAEEMDLYLDVLTDIKIMTESKRRTWSWLKPWRFWHRKQTHEVSLPDPEREPLLQKAPIKGIKRSALPKGIPTHMLTRRDTFNWEAAPQKSKFLRSMSQKLLKLMRFMTRDDILFGIKVGIGAILWAMFAFIPGTKPVYRHWRGEWGLLSYMIVVGMTTGASNTTSTSRFLGTIIGATCACISWLIGQTNPYVLAVLGWLISLWNFYLILVVKNGPLGRITLLAYNVIVLYAYSLSQQVDDDDDDEGGSNPLIFDITYHRVIAVTLGILWGMIICRLLWPISARTKFREGLAVLYLQLGLIWKRGPLGTLLEGQTTEDYMREGEQAALRRYAFKLEALRTSAASEFELRGPFPQEAYGRIMRSTKHILDGFYAMRLITQKHHRLSTGERAILVDTAEERRLLCQRICHVFQVLASCIMLEYPLTDAIPTVENNKDRLLGRVYRFRKEAAAAAAAAATVEGDAAPDGATGPATGSGNGTANAPVLPESMAVTEKDFALLYAYTLVTSQVAEELKKARADIEELFGMLNEDAMLLE